MIRVNLGKGTSWWSTRLHLLSALCADYTEVRQIVFEAEGSRFLCMCTPAQARRALAREYPNVETAYRECLPSPEKMSSNPVGDVSSIVGCFTDEMDKLGGEETVKQWIAPHLVKLWPGVNKDSFEVPGGAVTRSLFESIVSRKTPFVVLVRDGNIEHIVDRSALATRLAISAP